MGRLLRRVPLDFDWPFDKTWEGYINPHYKACPNDDCVHGSTPARAYLEKVIRLLFMAANDSLRKEENGERRWWFGVGHIDWPKQCCTPDMQELVEGLAGKREMSSIMGYSGTVEWLFTKNLLAAAGLDVEKWGICPTCNGEAIDPEVQEAYENWEMTDPPKGEGFQLWQNTSEGSPISPVFDTLDKLCEWAEVYATTFGHEKTTKENWKKMLDDGFVHHRDGNNVFI